MVYVFYNFVTFLVFNLFIVVSLSCFVLVHSTLLKSDGLHRFFVRIPFIRISRLKIAEN